MPAKTLESDAASEVRPLTPPEQGRPPGSPIKAFAEETIEVEQPPNGEANEVVPDDIPMSTEIDPVIKPSASAKKASRRRSQMNPSDMSRSMLLAELVLRQSFYRVSGATSLVAALFGTALTQILNLPDDPWNILVDTTMCLATAFFLTDLAMQCLADPKHYPGCFFFWMDVLGSVSMIFEISFLLGEAGKINSPASNVDGMVMRAARAAKLGARAGRLLKLLKCLTFILGTPQDAGQKETDSSDVGDNATKRLANSLSHYLSSKAAMSTIGFVLVVPMLSLGTYPEDDLSLRTWPQRLEDAFEMTIHLQKVAPVAGLPSNFFQRTVSEMESFYSEVDYFPYRIEGWSGQFVIDGVKVTVTNASMLEDGPPARKQNVVRQIVPTCNVNRPSCQDLSENKAAVYYDFTKPHQYAAGMDALTIVVMIVAMFGLSLLLMRIVDSMVLEPINGIMFRLRDQASGILASALKSFEDSEESDQARDIVKEDTANPTSELGMLELVFTKLRKIVDIHTSTAVVDDTMLEGMDDESKGVICEIMQKGPRRSLVLNGLTVEDATLPGGFLDTMPNLPAVIVKDLPVDQSVINSWGLHVLELGREDQGKVVLHIIFDSAIGRRSSRQYLEQKTFDAFHDAVRAGYNDIPYHSYNHACDILYVVSRLLETARAPEWCQPLEQYSLLIAALCHDMGHAGLTNPFLVETRDELALRYNDKSPLENMHCATLFKVCSEAATNVFEKLSDADYKSARAVCVSAILHTDNYHHFDMVKTIKGFYEIDSHTCDRQAGLSHKESLDPTYVSDVMKAHKSTWMDCILHLADVSNPMRPFRVCQAWAWLVLDEFFAQGDREKALGIPVGMLNDREKINRPHSQHGFIKFLVAPFAFTTVKLFPCWHPLTTHMANNIVQWHDMWVNQYQPPKEEIAQCEPDCKKIKDEAEEMEKRTHRKSAMADT